MKKFVCASNFEEVLTIGNTLFVKQGLVLLIIHTLARILAIV